MLKREPQRIGNFLELNQNQIDFLDLRSVDDRSNTKPTTYLKKKKSKPLVPIYYRFRLLIFFNNRKDNPDYKGTWLTSYDFYKGWNGNYIDEHTGLTKLKSLVKHEYKGKYSTAVIFMSSHYSPTLKSKSHKYPVAIWYKDQERNYYQKKPIIRISFKVDGSNNYVNLESEKLKDDIFKFTESRKITEA